LTVAIREKTTGTLLASGDVGPSVVKYEGNWYFAPETVQNTCLRVTDRTCTCPHKGTCNWVEFLGPDGTVVKDVAWVYPSPKPGHEQIKNRFGFYAGSRGSTTQD
jgi:uncharacterized protein (DUF427 family)